jgi:N-acetylneuraminate lyase
VGSTYNFAAPIYHRLRAAFERGDLDAAREEQFRSAQLVKLLAGYGYMGSAKALMKMLGVDVGPARLPHANPTPNQTTKLKDELEQLSFFEWITMGDTPPNRPSKVG